MATISARNSNLPNHEKMKWKHMKMKRRKKCRLTCTKELYTHQNWHKAGSVTPKAATFSCNERSHRGLSTCNRQNGGQAIPVPYRLYTYKVPGLLWSPYHVGQLSGNHLYIYEQEPPLPHIIADKSFSHLIFWSSPFASANEFKTWLRMRIKMERGFSWVSLVQYQKKEKKERKLE
jgi:hypothetical protein